MRNILIAAILGIFLVGCSGITKSEQKNLNRVKEVTTGTEYALLANYYDNNESSSTVRAESLIRLVASRTFSPFETEKPFCDVLDVVLPVGVTFMEEIKTNYYSEDDIAECNKEEGEEVEPPKPDLAKLDLLIEAAKECNIAKVRLITKGVAVSNDEIDNILLECKEFKLQEELQK